MWVRGLKPRYSGFKTCKDIVAPYVGAWIETIMLRMLSDEYSRTLCGCVD